MATTTHDELAELRAKQVRPPRQITTRERVAQLEAAERRERGLAIARKRVPGYDALLEAARAAEATAKADYDREIALRHQRSLKSVEDAKRKLTKAGPFARFRPETDVDDNFDNAQVIEPTPFGSVELVRPTLEETIAENRWRLALAERLRLERLPLRLWQAEDAEAGFARGEELRRERLDPSRGLARRRRPGPRPEGPAPPSGDERGMSTTSPSRHEEPTATALRTVRTTGVGVGPLARAGRVGVDRRPPSNGATDD